ncbi:MAG TPA: DUF2206 domain-containing protein [Microlunatus sp.]
MLQAQSPAGWRLPVPLRAVGPDRWFSLAVVVLVAALVAVRLVGPSVGGPLHAVAGLLLTLALPAVLLHAKIDWPVPGRADRWLLTVPTTVLGLYLLGLLLDYGLPLLGVERPLDRIPVLLGLGGCMAFLALWRPSRRPRASGLARRARAWVRRHPGGVGMACLAIGVVLLSIIGAVRLDNGAGGLVAMIGLASWAATMILLLVRHQRMPFGTRLLVLYALSLAFVVMTSLRGWYITGHDNQYEYKVFDLTHVLGGWHPEVFRSAYYACLSITILPAMLASATGLSGAMIFKVVLQVVFAVCPVMLFMICRRVVPEWLALLGVVFFLIFPTYFSDLPFLIRQQLAFLFLAAVLMLLRTHRYGRRRRMVWALAFAVGILLSHYSTNYVFLATMIGAWMIGLLLPAVSRLAAVVPLVRPPVISSRVRPLLGLAVIGPLLVLTLLWTSPITHSGGQFQRTFASLSATLSGEASATRSSDTAYSIFGPKATSPAEKLATYQAEQAEQRAAIGDPDYLLPLADVVDDRATFYTPPTAAFSPIGKVLAAAGLPPSTLNKMLRSGIAAALQVFVVIGLLVVAIGRYRGRPVNRELFALGVASFAVVAAQVVLPALSVDYGVLRAFQQALFTLAPFLAIGCAASMGLVFRRHVQRACVVVAAFFTLSLCGFIPQALGGYPLQLHLNNAGQYYDIYYTHPEEVAAMNWLNTAQADAGTDGEVSSDRYTSARLQNFSGTQPLDAIYPTQLRSGSYVVLGTTTVRNGTVAIFFEGDVLTYVYPMAALDDNKSLIYSSGGARIYR